MVGAMAHPLNRAIIDPELRIVTEGYGILQPRVGVSVQSASRSRLASIYSGQTGFDIYTRAISDAYQDLFGEGIFTGKGIYEINALHAVLDRRFPRNSLLSHDLIEGSYARVGLTTDIEVIDDYPSHYSAYTRRKHRWLRGDWQIAQWLFAKVPDESGRYVRNPIATISRWKIFDNLRRSLVEVFTFALLLAGWLGLPGGALYWTAVTLFLMFVPTLVQLVFSLGRAYFTKLQGAYSRRRERLLAGHVHQLPQPGLPAPPDAAGPGRHHPLAGPQLYYRAALAGVGNCCRGRNVGAAAYPSGPLPRLDAAGRHRCGRSDLPAPSGVAAGRASRFLCCGALPGSSLRGSITRRSRPGRSSQSEEDTFLRQLALKTWRYFNQFGGKSHNYLIPDNVEEEGVFEAARVSPTNFGLLLNARQAANTFGYLTIPEFVALTERSLQTYDKMEKFRGHIFNWYDTRTLAPIRPITISSVDSGNLAASFYTLRTGCRGLLREPLLNPALFTGIRDHWQLLTSLPDAPAELKALAPPAAEAGIRMHGSAWALRRRRGACFCLASMRPRQPARPPGGWQKPIGASTALVTLVRDYMPWLLPQFAPLLALPQLQGLADSAAAVTIVSASAHWLPISMPALPGHATSLAADSPLCCWPRSCAIALGTGAGKPEGALPRAAGSFRRSDAFRHRNGLRLSDGSFAAAALDRV